EIIKTSLLCAGPLADRVHRSSAVAVFPHQIQRRVGQAFFHVTHSRHIELLHSVDRPVNYFVRTFSRTPPEEERRRWGQLSPFARDFLRRRRDVLARGRIFCGRAVGRSTRLRFVLLCRTKPTAADKKKRRDEDDRARDSFHLVWRSLADVVSGAR